MPALAPVSKVLQVRWLGTDATDISVGSRMFVQYGGAAPTSAQLNTYCAGVATGWVTNMAPVTDTGFTLTEVTAVDLSTPSSATGVALVSHPGTRVGNPLPLNVAQTIHLPTALRRRGGRWHIQLRAGVDTDLATPQTWNAPWLTAVINAFGGFTGPFGNAPWPSGGPLAIVGVQYYGPPNRTITSSTGRVRTVSTPLAVPVVWPVVGVATARTILGSQRRRL